MIDHVPRPSLLADLALSAGIAGGVQLTKKTTDHSHHTILAVPQICIIEEVGVKRVALPGHVFKVLSYSSACARVWEGLRCSCTH